MFFVRNEKTFIFFILWSYPPCENSHYIISLSDIIVTLYYVFMSQVMCSLEQSCRIYQLKKDFRRQTLMMAQGSLRHWPKYNKHNSNRNYKMGYGKNKEKNKPPLEWIPKIIAMEICHLKNLFEIKTSEQDFHTPKTLKYAHKYICIQYSCVNSTRKELLGTRVWIIITNWIKWKQIIQVPFQVLGHLPLMESF